MKYVFYFDEAFHDRKIVLSEQGSINTLREEAIDDYVGVFWGFKSEYFNEFTQQLTDFERKYKRMVWLEICSYIGSIKKLYISAILLPAVLAGG